MKTLSPPAARVAIDWVRIPAGRFVMGGVEQDKFVTAVELPVREVTIQRPFFMSRHPVTCGQWAALNGGPARHPDLPVTGVSWDEAREFCRRLDDGARLPSEAEWEYACRAGTRTVFCGSDRLQPGDANYLYDEMGNQVGPGGKSAVGTHPPNGFGVADLLGNVCEWTADLWHAGFAGAPCDGTPWLDGGAAGRRVIRGGAWDHLPRVLRASWRDWAPERARWDNLGFRVVKDEQP